MRQISWCKKKLNNQKNNNNRRRGHLAATVIITSSSERKRNSTKKTRQICIQGNREGSGGSSRGRRRGQREGGGARSKRHLLIKEGQRRFKFERIYHFFLLNFLIILNLVNGLKDYRRGEVGGWVGGGWGREEEEESWRDRNQCWLHLNQSNDEIPIKS